MDRSGVPWGDGSVVCVGGWEIGYVNVIGGVSFERCVVEEGPYSLWYG